MRHSEAVRFLKSRFLPSTLLVVLSCFLMTTTNGSAQQPTSAQRPAFTDAQVEARVSALLGQMTLQEKIGQMNQIPGTFPTQYGKPEDVIRKGMAGSVLWISDPAAMNRLQHIAVDESRLHIPILFGLDVVQGFHTIFPVPLATASSWDPAMVEREQSIAAREARAGGILWTFAPMVDIARDPRWGRIVEGAGEDPYLGAAMARAQVRGFQGASLGPDSILACVKHFAGYGAADGGRDYDSSFISEDQMWNVYLPPFRAAVNAGVGTAMSAYMDLNNVPATGNRWLLHDVLREDMGFKGFVVSDAEAIGSLVKHGYARDREDAAFKAMHAGVDMDMVSGSYPENLEKLVQQGRVSVAQIDAAVRPILAAKIKLGLFDSPYIDESKMQPVFQTKEHKDFARIAAQRSIVLLRNQNHTLPLDKTGSKIKTLAVIGPVADNQKDLAGMWGSIGDTTEVVTILQGIRNKLGNSVKVEFAKGPSIRRVNPSPFETSLKLPADPVQSAEEVRKSFDDAVSTARKSDAVVMVLGESAVMHGEYASRASLTLSGEQQHLLEAVVATGKPAVLVLINGRPLDISWVAEHVPAIVEAWVPGSQGGNAVADVLFGDTNPGGKLPVSWPRSVGQVPIFYAHNLTQQHETDKDFKSRYWDIPSSPLYPFGYGLSYTTFAYSNLKVSNPQPKRGESFEVTVDVQNTGKLAGDEVVQLYTHQTAGSASRPVRELKGFQRISLAPGEKKTVRFALGKDELSYWSTADKKWVQDTEKFQLWTGGDSTATLEGTFTVVE